MGKLSKTPIEKWVCLASTLLSFSTFGQNSVETIGFDYVPTLSTNEFTILLDDVRGKFEWSGKKMAYVTGSLGRSIQPRETYLEIIKRYPDSILDRHFKLHFLSKEEKELSGGYDGIISFYVKRFSKLDRRKVIKKLARERRQNCKKEDIKH